MKAKFFYKVFGLAEDEDNNPTYAYIKTGPKNGNDEYVEIDKEDYEPMRKTFLKMVANQVGVHPDNFEPISESEYLENAESEGDE